MSLSLGNLFTKKTASAWLESLGEESSPGAKSFPTSASVPQRSKVTAPKKPVAANTSGKSKRSSSILGNSSINKPSGPLKCRDKSTSKQFRNDQLCKLIGELNLSDKDRSSKDNYSQNNDLRYESDEEMKDV